MSVKNILAALAAALLLAACSGPKPAEPATLLLLNGHFFTADSLRPEATAMALRGDRILYVGDETGARALADKSTQTLDLQGHFAMPGFIEGHGHFTGLGSSLLNINLMDTKSWDEIVARVAEKVKTARPGEWIEGRGWHQEKWSKLPEKNAGGYPYHDLLSAISPENPVILRHASGHSLFANEKAIAFSGINRETADPAGGRIVRDAAGRAVGVFEENAMDLIEKPWLAAKSGQSEAEERAYFEKCVALASRESLENGVTSFQDAGSSFWEIAQLRRLAEAGKLDLRLWVMISQPRKNEFSKLADFPLVGLGRNHLTVRAVKCYLDGALGSYGAWLLGEYADKPGFFGQNTTPTDTIAAVAAECRRHNLQCCVHAIGDRGNREVLNIFENAFKNTPGKDLRWRIEHSQHLDPQDIPRFGALGVIASMQAIHCTSDAPFVVKRLGETRARLGAYPWRSLLDSGARLANGSDVPVEDIDPLACIYASVTRRRADSGLEFFPQQAMTRQEALLSYTLWNAFAAFEESEKGSLTVGKLADIVVLDKNLLTCAPEEILRARVLKTIVGGAVKFGL